MKRFAAKLLFQFRVDVNGDPGKRRLCEERIVIFKARSAKSAMTTAKRKGRADEHDYLNCDGNRVYFELIGVMDLLELGVECEADEVWYELHYRNLPMERREQLIPADEKLINRCRAR